MVNWITIKVPRQFNGEKTIFSTNRDGKIGYLYAKKKFFLIFLKEEENEGKENLDLYFTQYTKININGLHT